MDTVHPSLMQRKIIHFDMDAFYASIEIRDNPELKGKPVVVGGSPQSRGVVCTASYEARKFGIRSAMACAKAYRLCPKAIFVPVNFEKYRAVSQHVRQIFQKYTSKIEPLSLDEAYLDVTENTLGVYAVKIARLIQKDIADELQLTGSAGVAPNKLVAKIASDIHKPNGITVITPEKVSEFMKSLPLRRIHGVGPVTEKRLAGFGLITCEDVWKYDEQGLVDLLGENTGTWLHRCTRGIDERPVQSSSVRKSLGQEETFATDLLNIDQLQNELLILSQGVAESLQKRNLKGRTITLKVRYDNFERITRAQSLEEETASEEEIFETVKNLLLAKTEAGRRKIRLLGVSVSGF